MRWDKKERGNARIIEQRLSISLVKRGKDYRDGGGLLLIMRGESLPPHNKGVGLNNYK